MFFDFLEELRRHKVPVGAHEAVALAGALEAGLHQDSLEGFRHVARALLVHSETQLDAFERAFDLHFRGAGTRGLELTDALLEWLKEARERGEALSEAERALLEQFDPETLEAMFQERLRTQTERHDGGNHWIGTGGTSPFGHSGRAARPGIRVGGPGGGRQAIRSVGGGGWEAYRDDVVIGVRQLSVALRKLRAFSREGGEPELDVEETIRATASNAGELEIKTRPPRRPNLRLVLLLDVGGSMDPHALLLSRLFTAARKATHLRELKTYYFHNCVYGRVYTNAAFTESLSLDELFQTMDRRTRLMVVGDAMMAPYELTVRGGGRAWNDPDAVDGLTWLMRLSLHFERAAWLNPEPEASWGHPTVEAIQTAFPHMYPMTLRGLGDAVDHLVRGATSAR
ncbi:MAG TPA: VWA domain-containing protein [Myxococcaceae bacterium]|nr:VWA domain-containing protein [Myxococcaceae bacterium]